jgi:hypothetical protein
MVYPIFQAGRAGFSMLRYLYKGASKTRKAIGFTDKAKKLERSVEMAPKVLTGKYGSKRQFLKVRGGLGNKAKFYTAQGMQGVAHHAKKGGKFIRKHHKYATTAVGGAAAWDILDSD